MSDYRCPRCVTEYGQTGRPKHFGNDPLCGFTPEGAYRLPNWQCATMNALRELIYAESVRDDMGAGSAGIAYLPESETERAGWIVMTWYKDRGATGNVICIRDSEPDDTENPWQFPLTLACAERALADRAK